MIFVVRVQRDIEMPGHFIAILETRRCRGGHLLGQWFAVRQTKETAVKDIMHLYRYSRRVARTWKVGK